MDSCFPPFHRGLFGSTRPASVHESTGTNLNSIQDLDLYFMQQIAHSLEEYDLEQKIDLEIKMREGTTKLLAACKHQSQTLEAAKSLITSNERMTAYMMELQRRKALQRHVGMENRPTEPEPSKAKVAVSDIRMPLIWKDSDHFKNKGDYRRFNVFCLLKIGTEVYDTAMLNNVDRSMTDISFEDVIVFNRVNSNFEFVLEVYSHVLREDLSIASASNKLRRRLSNSVSRTIGKKLAVSMKEELGTSTAGPKFDLVARATLKLDDANPRIKTHDLILENLEERVQKLPLFGHFCCRLAVKPECTSGERFSGNLGLVQNTNSLCKMWGCLKDFKLSLWTNLEESHHSQAVVVIRVDKNSRVTPEAPQSPYCWSFRLTITNKDQTQEHTLVADTEEDKNNWVSSLRQHSEDHARWSPATDMRMEIPSPGSSRNPVFLRTRHSSLYEDTPFSISESGESTSNRSSLFLDYSSHRLSSPSFRSRSSSSSSTSSFGSSKQYLSFFRRSCKDLPLY